MNDNVSGESKSFIIRKTHSALVEQRDSLVHGTEYTRNNGWRVVAIEQ